MICPKCKKKLTKDESQSTKMENVYVCECGFKKVIWNDK
jgi:predicted RNA-binding Zn-ribbon protein involved in translation (DUF1610 family)